MYKVLFLFLIVPFVSHDLHLSMCNINFNQEYQRIEIEQRIFLDDLEDQLKVNLKDEKFDIINPDPSLDIDSIFEKYLNKNIELIVDDNRKEIVLLEYALDDAAFVFYMYIEGIKEVNRLSIYSSILFNLYDDQTNIVSVKVEDVKKSARFELGSKEKVLEF